MASPIPSLSAVCDVTYVRGAAAAPDAPPDLLLEVAHGATRAGDFTAWTDRLRGSYGEELLDFFFVNTDVGAPELALAIARDVVARAPARTGRCAVAPGAEQGDRGDARAGALRTPGTGRLTFRKAGVDRAPARSSSRADTTPHR